MEPILAGIIAALVAGATAKAKDVASDVVVDAYNGLKSLITRKLGKAGAVQSVEDDPDSSGAQAALAEALARANLQSDEELKQKAAGVEAALSHGLSNIDVMEIRGRVNAIVERLVAQGSIKLGSVIAETGDATVRDLSAGVPASRAEPRTQK